MIKKIGLRFEGTNYLKEAALLDTAIKDLENVLELSGEVTRTVMVNRIQSQKKRKPSKGTLENWIRVHKVKKTKFTLSVGVGKVSSLQAHAPYYSIINYGGWVPPVVTGSFPGNTPPLGIYAGTGVGTERFTEGQGHFKIRPKNPVPGFRYIQAGIKKGNSFYSRKFDAWQSEWDRKIKANKEVKQLI